MVKNAKQGDAASEKLQEFNAFPNAIKAMCVKIKKINIYK